MAVKDKSSSGCVGIVIVIIIIVMFKSCFGGSDTSENYTEVKSNVYSDLEILGLISFSDDLEKNKEAFISATKLLLKKGYASSTIKNVGGGWIRSQNKGRGVYFIQLGDTNYDRWYTDSSGKIYQ